ncbi:MAG: SRPBCC family protein [Myxococcota bacterium]
MRVVGLVSLVVAIVSSSYGAAHAQEADELPLRGFTRSDLDTLAPYLDRGPVLMAQFRDDREEAPAIVMATRVNAPPDKVAEVIRAPETYPSFMPALDSINVESRRQGNIAYSWSWRIAVFTLSGSNVMTVYPSNPRRGHRIDVRSTGGDLGRGRMSWRVIPDGPGKSLLMLTSRIDMRNANYLADQMSSGGMAVFRSINVALSTVMLLGTRRQAEGAPREAEGELPPLERFDVDANELQPLANRGDLVFLELHGEELARVSVLGRMASNVQRSRAVMLDPEEFGRSLMHGARARVVERTEDHVDFEWEIPLPLVGVEGRMRMLPTDNVIGVEGVEGSLRSGRWGFDTHVWPSQEAAVIGWGRFDPRETSRLIRRLIAGDNDFAHGLAIATQIMVVRSLRTRVMRYQR